jgi:hypothetical protein
VRGNPHFCDEHGRQTCGFPSVSHPFQPSRRRAFSINQWLRFGRQALSCALRAAFSNNLERDCKNRENIV